MYYEEFSPHAALRAYIRCYFYIRVNSRSLHLPADGCPGLVISLGDPFLLGAEDSVLEPFTECRVFGSFARQMLTRHPWQTELVAVKFLPGQIARFFDVPGIELTDTSTTIESLWGSYGQELQREIFEANTIPEIIQLIDTALIARLSRRYSYDDRIFAALRAILLRSGQVGIEDLAQEVGLSRRHFERLFIETVGLTPKRLCRIVRFSSIFSHLHQRAENDWADIAVAYGYSDQAHLIRECKFFTGFSPLLYLKHRSPLEHAILGTGSRMSHFFNTADVASATMDESLSRYTIEDSEETP